MSVRNSDPLFQVEGLTKYFHQNVGLLDRLDPNTRRQKVHAVDSVDLAIGKGDVIGIVGESGCGKSTMARTMLRLLEPSGGRIFFEDEDVTAYSKGELKDFRKDAQLIYQDPNSSLNPRHTVARIVRKPLDIHGIGDSRDEREERVIDLLEQVGLGVEHLDSYPNKLSGGQKQRVAIARALAVEPKLLVADEVTSTLDASVQARILNLLYDLQQQNGLTMVFISHDLSVISHISDRVAVMYLGKIVENAPTDVAFERPKHPYTETLFSSIPLPDPDQPRAGQRLEGEVPDPIDPPSGCRFHTRCPKLIPPEEWAGSQSAWLELFRLKQSIEEFTAETDGDSSEAGDVQSLLSEVRDIRNQIESDVVLEHVNTVESHIENHEFEESVDFIKSQYVSPCEVNDPALVREGKSEVRCFLYGDGTVTDRQLKSKAQ